MMSNKQQAVQVHKKELVSRKAGGKKQSRNTKGVALYMAIVVMSILFSVAFGMSSISVSRIKSLNSIGNSVVAFYAAEAGIEQAIDESIDANYNVPHAYLDTNGNGYEDDKDATYEVIGMVPGSGKCPLTYEYCIKSIGKYMDTRRTIQIEFK